MGRVAHTLVTGAMVAPPLWERVDGPKGKNSTLAFNFHPGQAEAWAKTERFVTVIAGSQSGKALALDTEIPTPDGFKTMAGLRVGDQVYSAEGGTTTITYTSPVFQNHPCYRVIFNDGTVVVADEDHLWRVSEFQGSGEPSEILSTKAIAEAIRTRGAQFSVPPAHIALHYIVACDPTESVPTRCIAVAAPSHQFLCTRSYIPTHNTSWGPIWLWREIQRCGSGDYLAVTASYDLFQLKMLPELRNFFEHLLGIATYRASERVLQLSSPPDTRIILRSASSPEGLESSTAKAAWCDEAGQETFTLGAWEAVQRRTALHRGRILITTTPYLENWLKFDVYDKWAIDHDPDYAVVNFPSTFNPVYPKEEFDRAKRTWPTWKFNLFILGTFDRPAGLIYDCFNTDEHVVDDFDLPASWPRWVGIDFGAVNHAMVWVALNPETQVMYVYREELSSDATTPERARAALLHAKHENVVGWYGGAKSERQYRSDWRAAGVHIRQPLVSDVEAGIDAVTSVIKEDRFRVFRSCTRLRDELGSYRRKLDDRGNPTVEILNKSNFHCADGLRYVLPSVGRKRLAKVIPFGMPRPSPWNQMRARA